MCFSLSVSSQVSQATVARVDASESVSRHKRSFGRCMRNKILRFANNKYRYSYFLFNKVNKKDLHLMYFCGFRWEFIDLVVFLALIELHLYNSIHKTKSRLRSALRADIQNTRSAGCMMLTGKYCTVNKNLQAIC